VLNVISYLIYSQKEAFISRDVVFFKHIFPYKKSHEDTPKSHSHHNQSYFDDLIPNIDHTTSHSNPTTHTPTDHNTIH
jgi:hypothetical protein